MSIALWKYISMDIPAPAIAANGTPHADLPKWIKHTQQAMESLILCVAPSIQQDVLCFMQSHEIWEHLDDIYGTAMLTSVYKDSKEALNICINANQHPGPQVDKMVTCFQHLTSNSIIIPNQIQAMMLLAALLQKWEILVNVIMQTNNLADLDISNMCTALLAQYEEEATHSKGGNNKQQANKLSTVKQKCGDPNFSNQQKGNQQHEQTRDKPCQCGQHGKGKGKKNQQGQHGHSHNVETSHIANITSITVPSTSTIAQISPSSLSQHTITAAPAKECTSRPYKSLNKALNLANHIGVKATIEIMKMLEQCIVDQYMDGPCYNFPSAYSTP